MGTTRMKGNEMEQAIITKKLDELSEVRAAADVTRLDYEAKRREILAKVQDELTALDAEFAPMLEAANMRVAELEADIKARVLEFGSSVKSTILHAIFSKGRVTWDAKALDGYAAGHPEIAAFRKEGEPSVSIRVVK